MSEKKLPYRYSFIKEGETVWVDEMFVPDSQIPVEIVHVDYKAETFSDEYETYDFECAYPEQYVTPEEYFVKLEIKKIGIGLGVSDFLSEEEWVLALGEVVYRIYNAFEGL